MRTVETWHLIPRILFLCLCVCVCLIQKVSELNMIQEEMRKMKEIEVQREQDIVHVRTHKKNPQKKYLLHVRILKCDQ